TAGERFTAVFCSIGQKPPLANDRFASGWSSLRSSVRNAFLRNGRLLVEFCNHPDIKESGPGAIRVAGANSDNPAAREQCVVIPCADCFTAASGLCSGSARQPGIEGAA